MIAISLPFRIDGYGRVATTSDMYKVYADRVRSLVSTHRGERVMLPGYGANVVRGLFDTLGTVPELMDIEVSAAFSDWLPELTYKGIDLVAEDAPNGETRVAVNYEVPPLALDPQVSPSQVVDVVVALN